MEDSSRLRRGVAVVLFALGASMIGYALLANPAPADTPLRDRGPELAKSPAEWLYEFGCTHGCHPNKHPIPTLTRETFEQLLHQYAEAPVDEPGEGIDDLLFYDAQTRYYLDIHGHGPLDDERRQFLESELRRTHAWVEMRVTDEFGVVRAKMPPTPWPFDQKQHYFPGPDELVRLQTPDFNGTIKRVGLHHIWMRC